MKIITIALLMFITAGQAFSQPEIAIIPQPVSIVKGSNGFVVMQNTSIHFDEKNKAIADIANLLNKQFKLAAGYQLPIKNLDAKTEAAAKGIMLLLNKTTNPILATEGYQLICNETGIRIEANEPAGLYYGTQTLLQLLPKEIESKAIINNYGWLVPGVTITDYPRFGWRGLMFDVSRHFFTKAEVKDFIDQMAKYKYNLLHLHLTDDQGWRIEIKALPKINCHRSLAGR